MSFVDVFRQYDMAIIRKLHTVFKVIVLKDTCKKAATKYTPLCYIMGLDVVDSLHIIEIYS
jgi:hypothetical protein